MGDLSKNFSRSEFACKCGDCEVNVVDAELIKILQDLHDSLSEAWGAPIKITINSGCRCWDHNEEIGGATYSQHLLGKAADIQVFFQDPQKNWIKIKALHTYKTLKDTYPNKYGIGNYVSFTHIDIRSTRARW